MLQGALGFLVFVLTALAVVVGVAWIVSARLRGQTRQARTAALTLLLWLAAYVVALLAVSLASRPRFIQPGVERCSDEMCYSVPNATVAPTVCHAPGSLAGQCKEYRITIRLRSAAKRTAQRPSLPDLFVMDRSGRQFREFAVAVPFDDFAVGQKVSGGDLWQDRVGPGQEVLRALAIELPADAQQAGLVLTEGFGPLAAVIIGDEGSLLHAKTQFVLPQ